LTRPFAAGLGAAVLAPSALSQRLLAKPIFEAYPFSMGACTATPADMRADFNIIEKVSVPDLPARIGGSLIAKVGRPGTNTD
jgi:hypothetical protein